MSELLKKGLERLKLEVTEDQEKRLERYISEIELFNPVYKLVAYEDECELVIRHILDSAAAAPVIGKYIKEGTRVADLGSGAGLPGIVLAILFPSCQFTLVERMARRAAFLKNVITVTGTKNVRILNVETRDVNEQFDLLTCRAYHPLYMMSEDARRLLAPSGVLCAYKGRRSYVEAELEGIEGFSWEFENIRVPFLDEPRLICTLRREK